MSYRTAGKFGRWTLFEYLVRESLANYNRSVNRLLIVNTNLDSFRLVNHG